MTEPKYKSDVSNLDSIGIWLINQVSAPERRQRMVEQLDSLGLPFQLFDGIDGDANRETPDHQPLLTPPRPRIPSPIPARMARNLVALPDSQNNNCRKSLLTDSNSN